MKNNNFWNELENCIVDNKYDLKKMIDYNFLNRDSWDRQIISYVLYGIERMDLFFCNKNENEIESYETLFLNILTKNEVDYSTFFTDLKFNNLTNLKNAYFNALKINYESAGINIFEKRFVPYLNSNRKYFCDDLESTLEILNSNLPLELQKTYISYSSTKIINTDKILDNEIRNYYLTEVVNKQFSYSSY